jgi:glycosyltransferase involved in cell wall biosynthesis
MPKKKILFVMQLPPPVHGVSAMNKIILESNIINGEFDCDYINLATARDISDLQKNRFRKYLRTIGIYLKVCRKLLFNRYHRVYVTLFPYGFSFIKDSIVVLIARAFRTRPLLHLHTYGFGKGANGSAFAKKYYQFVFRNSEVICLSQSLTEDIAGIFNGPVHILQNGIPQVNFLNNYKTGDGVVNVLYLSNLIPGKGILVLLDAVEILKAKNARFHLRVAGAENDITYDMLRRIISEKDLHSHVTLVGPLYGEKKYQEFRNSEIFVLPTDYDTFGLVLLEAMQFGVPCISTNVGAIPELLANGRGLIIPEIEPEVLAEAIARLVDSPETRTEMSRRSFSYFEQHLTSEVFERELLNIFLNGRVNTPSGKNPLLDIPPEYNEKAPAYAMQNSAGDLLD